MFRGNNMAQIETNLQETVKQFEAMQISGHELEKTLHKLVSNVIKAARNRMSQRAKEAIGNDPRNAYKAVKHMVYKRILGGNISILNKKRRSGQSAPLPSSRRSGNRSKRTEDLLSYYGEDRGFILRFLNSGTNDRTVRSYNNGELKDVSERRNGNRTYKGGPYSRGRIQGRNWFPGAGQAEMKVAAEQLAQLIELEIAKFDK